MLWEHQCKLNIEVRAYMFDIVTLELYNFSFEICVLTYLELIHRHTECDLF